MTIQRDDVVKAAALARVRLTPAEVEGVAQDLARVVGWILELEAVDTTGVEPMMQPIEQPLAPSLAQPLAQPHPDGGLRADVVQPVLGRRALEGSRGYEDGLVRVPKVID